MNWTETRKKLISLGIEPAVLPEESVYRIPLSGANLSGANLSGANLSGANLRGADLSDADLRGANLSDAYLSGANLRVADLRDADLRGANLSDAYLSGADLNGANLNGANLSDANLPPYQKWTISWQTSGAIKIGCKEKTVAEWDAWFAGDETFETERGTADFERIEAAYQHAKRMYEIHLKYDAPETSVLKVSST